MKEEKLIIGRGSCLRKNDLKELTITINSDSSDMVMVIGMVRW